MSTDAGTSAADSQEITRPEEHIAHRLIRTAGDWSGHIAEALGIAGLTIGIGLQLWDVLTRNLGFGSVDYSWVDDASSLGLIMGALIYVAATRRHIGFSGIADMIGNAALKRRLNLVTKPIVAALLIILAYYGIDLVHSQLQAGGSYSSAFYSPLWIFYAAFPLTCILAAIRWVTSDLRRPGDDADDDRPSGSAE